MKKTLVVIMAIACMLSSLKAQEQLTTDQIPKNLFGEYNNQYGRWELDFNPEFFNLKGYPWASVQGANVMGNKYTLTLKPQYFIRWAIL